jgi:hypothetical protein
MKFFRVFILVLISLSVFAIVLSNCGGSDNNSSGTNNTGSVDAGNTADTGSTTDTGNSGNKKLTSTKQGSATGSQKGKSTQTVSKPGGKTTQGMDKTGENRCQAADNALDSESNWYEYDCSEDVSKICESNEKHCLLNSDNPDTADKMIIIVVCSDGSVIADGVVADSGGFTEIAYGFNTDGSAVGACYEYDNNENEINQICISCESSCDSDENWTVVQCGE